MIGDEGNEVHPRRHYIAALITAGLMGFAVGAGLGLRDWSWAWPQLSVLKIVRSGAVGWLLGLLISPAAGWLLSRRASAAAPPGSSDAHPFPRALLALALIPGVLWLPGVDRIGPLRKATAPSNRLGDRRPNLVLITIDALRADHLGVYGNPLGLTPNLDAFAKDATRYDSAYASSPWTLTSLGALFTAGPPSQAGLKSPYPKGQSWYVGSAKLPADRTILSEQLQRAGYATMADVTNVFLEAQRGWDRGFDDFRNEGGVDGPKADLAYADTLTTNGLAWLNLNWRRPFFMWTHYLDPHCPYLSPDTPKELLTRYPSHWIARRDRWYQGMVSTPPKQQRRYQQFCREMYDEEVRYVDRWVGKLLAGLKAAGVYDNSLIVITADHGEELFDRGGMDHGHSMHDEVLRVPLLVKWPKGQAADKRVTQTVASADLAGTFLELARAPDFNGKKPKALPRNNGGPGEMVYSEATLYDLEQTALTTDRYRVIYHPTEGRFEVYDRAKGRSEMRDLADTDAALDLRVHLKQLTQAAQAAAQANEGKTSGSISLSEHTKDRLRALGYLGE